MRQEPAKPIVFRTLLLEDHKDLRGDIARRFRREFPQVQVIEASDIESGLTAIGDVPNLSLAILDVRVPLSQGRSPEAHPQVSAKLSELGVPIIFMTGFRGAEHDDVETFLSNRMLLDPGVVIVEKKVVPGYLTGALVRHAREFFIRIASDRINEKIIRFFQPSLEGMSSRTFEFMELQQEVDSYWAYLADNCKTRLRQRFGVKAQSDGHVELTLEFMDIDQR